MDFKTGKEFLNNFFEKIIKLQYKVAQDDEQSYRVLSSAAVKEYDGRDVFIDITYFSDNALEFRFAFSDINYSDDLYKLLNEFNSSSENPWFKGYVEKEGYLICDHLVMKVESEETLGLILDELFDAFATETIAKYILPCLKKQDKQN